MPSKYGKEPLLVPAEIHSAPILRSWMRKLGIAVLIIVVLLVAAVLIVPRLIDINQYHEQIQSELQKRLGRTVTLGEMHLSLFPPSFQVQNATIGEDPRFSFNQNRPFAAAEKLAVSVELMPL